MAPKPKARKRNRKATPKGDKPTAGKWAKFNTNSKERRDGTRKEGRCQLCLKREDLDDQFTVVNNLEQGTVTKKKNASSEANAHLSHYCGDCATKRVERKEYWMEKVREAEGPDQRGQHSTGRKRTKKASTKKAGRKRARKADEKPKRKRASRKADKAAAKPKARKARKRSKKAADSAGAAADEPF